MVEDDVNELSEFEIDMLFASIYKNYHTEDLEEKRRDIISSVIDLIREQAESEEIKYKNPSIEYIRYHQEDIIIIAKVLKQIGPADYLVHAYSHVTGDLGEQGFVDFNELDTYNAMERISKAEFEKELSKIRRIT
jgi:hypothetical protein